MKGLEYVVVVALLLLLWNMVSTKEGFAAEFVDHTNVRRTHERSTSNYDQETNHVKPTLAPQEPIPGMQTPFRVNMFNSFQPV